MLVVVHDYIVAASVQITQSDPSKAYHTIELQRCLELRIMSNVPGTAILDLLNGTVDFGSKLGGAC